MSVTHAGSLFPTPQVRPAKMNQVAKNQVLSQIGTLLVVIKANGYAVNVVLKLEVMKTRPDCVAVIFQTKNGRVFEAVVNTRSKQLVTIAPIAAEMLVQSVTQLNKICAREAKFQQKLAASNLQLENLIMVPCSAEFLTQVDRPRTLSSVSANQASGTIAKSVGDNVVQVLFYPRDVTAENWAPIDSLYVDVNKESLVYDCVNDPLNTAVSDALALVYKQSMTPFEGDRVMGQTIEFWRQHVNPGFLQYRKSVAQGADFAALDWSDPVPGSAVFCDHRGQRYLDLLGGFGIYNVGRRHPAVVAAVQAQLSKQALHSQELLDPLRAFTARIVATLMPTTDPARKLSHCFFVNSGTEAVEASLKAAYMATGRKTIIAAVNAFHGKTLGALACTSKSVFRQPFLGTMSNVQHVKFNDVTSLKCAFEASHFTGNEIAGLILEPVQGEGGVHVATLEYMQAARDLCDKYGACLIFDEVQTGMGRTGTWWACEHYKITPDIMAIGKAFGGGIMPAGACVATEKVWQKYFDNPFLFTTTFGGNPLAMAAAIAAIDTIMKENLLQAATDRGAQFRAGLSVLQKRHPTLIRQVRGLGLLIGVEFMSNEIGVEFSRGMFSKHVLVSGTLVNAQTIRVEPPLTITREQVDHALNTMGSVLEEIQAKSIAKNPKAKL